MRKQKEIFNMIQHYIKMKYSALFRLNNNAFIFISGIFISAAVNFYTTVCFSQDIQDSLFVYLSILFMFASSIMWLMLAVALQPLQDTFKQTQSNFSGVPDLWFQMISNKIGGFIAIVNTAIVFSVMSFVLLKL